jgi:hypothetical protein
MPRSIELHLVRMGLFALSLLALGCNSTGSPQTSAAAVVGYPADTNGASGNSGSAGAQANGSAAGSNASVSNGSAGMNSGSAGSGSGGAGMSAAMAGSSSVAAGTGGGSAGTSGGSAGTHGMAGNGGGAGTSGGAGMSGGGGATFTAVYAILMTNCSGATCHIGGFFPPAGLSFADKMTAYMGLVGTASRNCMGQQRVVAGMPDASVLVQALEHKGGCAPNMPEDKPALSMDDINVIIAWINAGAMND